MENPNVLAIVKEQRIVVPQSRENSFDLKVNRSNNQLRRQMNTNNSAFSDLSTSSSTSIRSIFQVKETRETQYKKTYKSNEKIFAKQPKMNQTLSRTKISPIWRAKMVNWMAEVFEKFKDRCSDQTFFRAVLIMDLFFKHHQSVTLENSDVYLIGITSIMISSKYVDLNPISLEHFNRMKSNTLPIEKINQYEYQILDTLSWEIYFPLVSDFIQYHMDLFIIGQSQRNVDKIRYLCHTLAKLCCLNVEFNNILFEVISLSILLFVLRYLDWMDHDMYLSRSSHVNRISSAANELEKRIMSNLGSKSPIVEGVVIQIYNHLKNLPVEYNQLDNIQTYNNKYEFRFTHNK